MSTKQARALTRDDTPARTSASAADRVVPPEQRDPNKIYTRDGREIGGLRFTGDEDMFNLDNLGVFPPDGWTYEWKTKTIKNWEWTEHQVQLYQNGWTPVPASRHDGRIMPSGHNGNIERGGMILMERDARLTAQARMIDKRKADDPVRESRQMAGLMHRVNPNAAGITDFDHGAARGATGVRVERQPRIAGGTYTYEE